MSPRAWIVAIIVIVLLIGGALYFSGRNAGGPNSNGQNTATGTASTTASSTAVRGTITAIDRSQVPSDGPVLITLRTDDGRTVTVAVPSMGLNQCAAKNNIEDVTTMRTGMEVEASGALDASGRIVPCQSPDDYLLVATK